MKRGVDNRSIRLVGHPFAPIGRGEDVRCMYRALRSMAISPKLTDVYKSSAPDSDELHEFSGACEDKPSDINLFHLNGNEVEQALLHLGSVGLAGKYNVVCPAWELSRYPDEWARQLDRFDEIWAMSEFVKESLVSACRKPVFLMPLSCGVTLSSFLSRRYFGISETDYTFLFFFDVRSYVTRKNPQAVIASFRKLMKSRPYAKARLILKVNGAEIAPDVVRDLHGELEDISDHVTVIRQLMSDNEVKNLVRCCDCFISLHRSEGFGRGIAEAMVLGKPVIATGYSGNMEFMDRGLSFPVDYELIGVNEGEYPHWEGQVWGDASVEDASRYMIRLVDDPEMGRAIGRSASQHLRTNFGYSAMGSRYVTRLEAICERI